jgi:hypothetical protein
MHDLGLRAGPKRRQVAALQGGAHCKRCKNLPRCRSYFQQALNARFGDFYVANHTDATFPPRFVLRRNGHGS